MNKDINFMTSTNLDELLEEHKKISHPYKSYEFDSTSYTLLLCDIKRVLKEKNNYKQALIDIRDKVKDKGQRHQMAVLEQRIVEDFYLDGYECSDILQIIDKAIGE